MRCLPRLLGDDGIGDGRHSPLELSRDHGVTVVRLLYEGRTKSWEVTKGLEKSYDCRLSCNGCVIVIKMYRSQGVVEMLLSFFLVTIVLMTNEERTIGLNPF